MIPNEKSNQTKKVKGDWKGEDIFKHFFDIFDCWNYFLYYLGIKNN